MLTNAHKHTLNTVCSEFLNQYENGGDDFLARAEIWSQHFESETKRQLMEWHHANSPTFLLCTVCFHRFGKLKQSLRGTRFEELILQPFRHFTYVTLILQPFCRFIYVTAHSPTLPLLLPTSQRILQPFFRFSYVTGSSLTSPGEPPMLPLDFSILGSPILLQNRFPLFKR